MSRGTIAIVSVDEDPHARIVRGLIRRDFGRSCEIIAVDRIADSGALNWNLQDCRDTALPTVHGATLPVAELNTLWWRRAGAPAVLPADVTDTDAPAQVTDDCINALGSMLRAEFQGAWVSHPDATRGSESKVVQLKAAHASGLRLPKTLVSQDPQRIRDFHAACDGQIVIKPLTTRPNAGVAAGKVTPALLQNDAALRLSPAIYQELVPGTRHLRAHVFGERCVTALIETDKLDWRFHLADAKFSPYTLDAATERALIQVLRRLGLRMGIFDFKFDAQGEPVWFEVNPQGQYLFLEALCDMPLSATVAEFLVAESDAAGA